MTEYNFDDLLAWTKASYVGNRYETLMDESTLQIRWSGIPCGGGESAKTWIYSNRAIVTSSDVTVEFKVLPGDFWKIVACTTSKDNNSNSITVDCIYTLHAFTAWDFLKTEITDPCEYDAITDYAVIKMKQFNPAYLVSAAEGIPASFTDQDTFFGKLSGVWYKTKTRAFQEKDGSGTILLFCTKGPSCGNVQGKSFVNMLASMSYEQFDYEDRYYKVPDPNGSGLVIGVAPYEQSTGYSWDKNVDRNENDNTWNVVIKKISPQSVSSRIVSTSATIYEISSLVENINQASAGTPVTTAPTTGEVKRVESEKTPQNLYNVKSSTTTEQAVTSAESSNTITAFETTSSVLNKSSASGTSLTSSLSSGVITDKYGTKTPGGLLDVRTVVKTAVASDTGWKTYAGRYGNNRIRSFKNQDGTWLGTALGTFNSGYSTSASIQKNEYDLFDGVLHESVPDPNSSQASDWLTLSQTWKDYQLEREGSGGTDRVRVIGYMNGVIQSNSKTDVINFIQGHCHTEFGSASGKHYRGSYRDPVVIGNFTTTISSITYPGWPTTPWPLTS